MGADNQSRESTLKEAMTTDQNTFRLIIGMGGGGLLINLGDGCIRRSLRFFITAKGRSVA